MLFGQDFGRRHDGGLSAALDGLQAGERGDDGFSAADIALQQAAHGPGAAQIRADFLPGFFYAFNRYYFEHNPQEASNILISVADRLPQKEGVLEIAAKWQEKGEDIQAALAVIRTMQRETRDAKLKTILQMRIDRLQGVIALREAAARYEKRMGRPLTDFSQLVTSGELEDLPRDPTGLGYVLNEQGNPMLYFPPRKPLGAR